MLSPMELRDFSGGITDDFIDAPPQKYKEADNFLITRNKKLYTRGGFHVHDVDYAQLPVGNQRVGTMLEFAEDLITQSSKKFYYDSGTAWEALKGPTLEDPLYKISTNSVVDYTIWNDQLYLASSDFDKLQKIYKDASGDYQVRTAGMPDIGTPSAAGTSGGATPENYVYGFHYYYEYHVGTVTHIDAGAVAQVQLLQITEPSVADPVSITNIPAFSNPVGSNYDDANIVVKIYRTIGGGDTLYLVGEVPNGTTTHTDSASDASIQANGVIYTTGGVLNNDAPPLAKCIHIVNGVCYYGNTKHGTSILNNRVMQSVLNDPDSVPQGNFIDLDDEIVAISSYMDRPLVFCKNSVYRLEGLYDETGGGFPSYQKIADTIGCVSTKSVVQTPQGIFFASSAGFGFTDGFKVITISDGFQERYMPLVKTEEQKRRIHAHFNRDKNTVVFSVQGEESSDNCSSYVLDLRWGITSDSSFTTLSGGGNYAPTAGIHWRGNYLHGDRRGYILEHKEEYLSDTRIDTIIAPNLWGSNPIIYTYTSTAIKPYERTRAFIPSIVFTAENTSNVSVQIISNSDIGNKIREVRPIRWRGNFIWGDPLFVWGNEDFKWGVQGFLEEKRYFHSNDLRCTYKQIGLTNANVSIVMSDVLGTATTDRVSRTVTLDDNRFEWLSDMTGFTISFEADNYLQKYPIIANSASTLTVLNTGGGLPIGSGLNWEVNGIPKDEILSLLSITLNASPLGTTQDVYSPAQAGGND